jgi:hypothetical protein
VGGDSVDRSHTKPGFLNICPWLSQFLSFRAGISQAVFHAFPQASSRPGVRMRLVIGCHHQPSRNLSIVRRDVEIVVTENVADYVSGHPLSSM